MPTTLTHALVAVAGGRATFRWSMPWKFWAAAVFCSAAPDLDVILMDYGVPYDALWGHRGMTHSLLFALVLGVVVSSWLFRRDAPWLSKRWWGLSAFFVCITASHGFLDAFTNGGLGVAFFSPFLTKRYFMPWTPIEVSPIGLENFIEYGGLDSLRSELLWVWLPMGAGTIGVVLLRKWIRSTGKHERTDAEGASRRSL